MKRVAVLGVTGSIGRQALEIVESQPELELAAAASGSQPIEGVAPLTQVGGELTELLERAQPDVVLNAVIGFAGLPATIWALERGVTLALANKESLVAAGELALQARERGGGQLLPVDSEHSAAFQCLEGRAPDQVDSLVLTGSGGPFRGRTRGDLEDVTPEEALAHPTWRMGPKITVDSATLAPLGYPDIRVPISFALTYPERRGTPIPPLDFSQGLVLGFEPPDLETFPLLALARRAGEQGGTYPCAFNAANEVAVAAFLEGRLAFLGIAATVEETLAAVEGVPARDLDDLIEADQAARRLAEKELVA